MKTDTDAQYLLDARLNKGWTQTLLALTTGLTQTTISNLENEKHKPARNTQKRLENALGCKLKFGGFFED